MVRCGRLFPSVRRPSRRLGASITNGSARASLSGSHRLDAVRRPVSTRRSRCARGLEAPCGNFSAHLPALRMTLGRTRFAAYRRRRDATFDIRNGTRAFGSISSRGIRTYIALYLGVSRVGPRGAPERRRTLSRADSSSCDIRSSTLTTPNALSKSHTALLSSPEHIPGCKSRHQTPHG